MPNSLVIAQAAPPGPPPTIHWSPCPATAGYRCGRLQVPLDYGHPSAGSLSLAVSEHVAPQSRGVVIFNPGGPGESGVSILPLQVSWVPAAVRDALQATLSVASRHATPEQVLADTFGRLGYLPDEARRATLKLLA